MKTPRDDRFSLRAALALALCAAAVGCTTDFDLSQLRPADAGSDVVTLDRVDAGLDAPDVAEPDAPDVVAPDQPLVDAPDVAVDGGPRCGAQGMPCCDPDAGAARCVGALVCTGVTCEMCPAGLQNCGGVCVSPASSASNCGVCGHACPDGNACVGGTCQLLCPMGYTACGGRCVSLASDPTHCGNCTTTCSFAGAAGRCEMTSCVLGACATGRGDCDANPSNGCEVDLQSSAANCGGCGVSCGTLANATARCVAGRCAVSTCATGFDNCDGVDANGCETDIRRDSAHCGTCATTCGGATPLCGAGLCVASAATCSVAGTADCDNSEGNGCEVTLATDASNCGRCGNVCGAPNATPACVAGACAIGACAAGSADCDRSALNGCESALATDRANCGACGNACVIANGTPACRAGRCEVNTCNDGFGDCDGDPVNGCETDLRASADHCGACGSRCAVANGVGACAAGVCVVGVCNTGFADCDRAAGNGCEADTTASVASCGGCGSVCSLANASSACTAGSCVLGACTAGFGDCDATPSTGCEANLASDRLHCGACGRVCVPANAVGACAGGRCTIASCNAGFGDCDGDAANGCETNLATTTANCGRCGSACTGGAVCSGGSCLATCAAGLMACGTSCVDTSRDTANCGSCGNVCSDAPNSSPTCTGGACSRTCLTGFANCDGQSANGCEVNLRTDRANCGGCGAVCGTAGGNSACQSGVCNLNCDLSHRDCNRMNADGCEVAILTDPSNCNACGNVCPTRANATSRCNSGGVLGCSFACNTGYANCDGRSDTGCEVNLSTSTTSCGFCGHTCTFTRAAALCVSGTCTLGACNTGYANCDGNAGNGCEVDITQSNSNCGACGNRCTGSSRCNSGRCTSG